MRIRRLRNWRSSQENARSVELSAKDSCELAAVAVSGSYLRAIASIASIDTARAQIETATTVYRQALDRNCNGLNTRIDVTRSHATSDRCRRACNAQERSFPLLHESRTLFLSPLIRAPFRK